MDNAKIIWNYFKTRGFTDYGIAGLIGNLHAESTLYPNNLENTANNKLGMTDSEYTAAVDNGTYTSFVTDRFGYGLAQWTWWTRKQGLLDMAKSRGCSIGDIYMQLDYLYKELVESFPSVLTTLKTATSILVASNKVLMEFECPADVSGTVQSLRASYSQEFYNRFAIVDIEPEVKEEPKKEEVKKEEPKKEEIIVQSHTTENTDFVTGTTTSTDKKPTVNSTTTSASTVIKKKKLPATNVGKKAVSEILNKFFRRAAIKK